MWSCVPTRALPFLLLVPLGCGGLPTLPRELVQELEWQTTDQSWHRGPAVTLSNTGSARFVKGLHGAFDRARALELTRFIDGFYRAPANDGYEAVIDRVAGLLRGAGFGAHPHLQLDMIETELGGPAWNPVSASLTMHRPGDKPVTLHAFAKPGDVDRVMLPINAPSCDVEGAVALSLEELRKGMILVTDAPAFQVLNRAKKRGAAAIVSASIGHYNADPSGKDRHLDAIQFRTLPMGNEMPVCQVSPNVFQRIERACLQAAGSSRRVRLEFRAEVESVERPLRTLVATIVGAERPDEVVAMGSHVQEPGACDNATGVAGLAESAINLAALIREGELERPRRSLVFLWGDEFKQTEVWVDSTELEVVAGISSDMTGQSKDTGAIALLERMPDPGAIITLPPDEHSLWGAGEVTAEEFRPNGLSVIARCAMIDVGVHEEGWDCADHPWEGGSDHDVFIQRGIPAVLFWHFTDFTYHTSLDRMGFVDPDEMRRTGVAILATSLAVADAAPQDLERYLDSLQEEERVRVDAALAAGDDELAAQWRTWCRGSRAWLRNLCLGIDEGLPESR